MMDGVVYFVECAGRIKIGYTTDLHRRLSVMRTGSALPLHLIGSRQGSRQLERAIHLTLKDHRSHLEWFEKNEAVVRVVQAIIGSGGDAIGFTERLEPKLIPTRETRNWRELEIALDRAQDGIERLLTAYRFETAAELAHGTLLAAVAEGSIKIRDIADLIDLAIECREQFIGCLRTKNLIKANQVVGGMESRITAIAKFKDFNYLNSGGNRGDNRTGME